MAKSHRNETFEHFFIVQWTGTFIIDRKGADGSFPDTLLFCFSALSAQSWQADDGE
jgi:hypothetical protein